MGIQTQQYKEITTAILTTDKTGTFGSTTLTAAVAAGATTLTVAAITNFSSGEVIRVGDGETMEVCVISGAPAGNSITIASGLKKAHASGEAVVEQDANEIGPVMGDSAKVSWSRESQDIFVASQRLVWSQTKGYGAMRAEFTFPAPTLYNIALALGIPASNIQGTGADNVNPTTLTTYGSEIGTLSNAGLFLNGKLNDGSNFRAEMYGVAVDYSGFQTTIARGQIASIPVKVLAGGGGVVSTSAAPFAATATTQKNAATEVIDYLSDAGYFAIASGSPANTTLGANAAAGAGSFAVAAGTDIAIGDWLLVGSGATSEIVRVRTIVTTTVTTAWPLLYAHSTGEAVVEQSLNSFSAVSGDGFRVAVSGNVSELRNAFYDMAVGLRPGAVALSLSVGLLAFTKANLARALGVADPGGSDLTTFANLGAQTINAVYAKGITNGARTMYFIGNYASVDVSAVDLALTNQGDAPSIPLTVKPASIHMQVHT